MAAQKPALRAPIVGVGAVVTNADGEVLLIRRGKPPLHREWSIPGGKVEAGETLHQALAREVREETGLEITIGELIDAVDAIIRDETGAPTHHYVLIDYAARAVGGELRAGSDAAEAVWVPLGAIGQYPMWSETRRVIHEAAQGGAR
jgi:8-oxo-dGTP diphosphatase